MYQKQIKRKWLVDLNKIDNLEQYDCCYIKYGYLSQEYDTLSVRVESVDDEFYLTLKDNGLKIRNCISYDISEDEFDISILLSGNKTLSKKRYIIPSTFDSKKIIRGDVYDDYGFVIGEYGEDDELLVDTLPDEEWFIKEITEDEKFYGNRIVYMEK